MSKTSFVFDFGGPICYNSRKARGHAMVTHKAAPSKTPLEKSLGRLRTRNRQES